MNDAELRPYVTSSAPDRTASLPGSDEPMQIWDVAPTDPPEGMRFDWLDEENGYVLVYEDTNIIFNLIAVE